VSRWTRAWSGLWYRSNLGVHDYELKRGAVPFVLPAAAITEETPGLGLEMALAPKTRVGNVYATTTTTLMVQTTWHSPVGKKAAWRGRR
jgi:hypothetical protein